MANAFDDLLSQLEGKPSAAPAVPAATNPTLSPTPASGNAFDQLLGSLEGQAGQGSGAPAPSSALQQAYPGTDFSKQTISAPTGSELSNPPDSLLGKIEAAGKKVLNAAANTGLGKGVISAAENVKSTFNDAADRLGNLFDTVMSGNEGYKLSAYQEAPGWSYMRDGKINPDYEKEVAAREEYFKNQTKVTTAETAGSMISAATGIGNLAFLPVTTELEFAKNSGIPGISQGAQAISWGFETLGKGAALIGNEAVDVLPVSDQAKSYLKAPVAELFSLAGMMLGAKGLHVVAKEGFAKVPLPEKVKAPLSTAAQIGVSASMMPVSTSFGLLKAGIMSKVAQRQAAGVEITPNEASRIVAEVAKETPIETPEITDVREFSVSLLAELEAKAKDKTITAVENEERKFLKGNINNPVAVAQKFGIPVDPAMAIPTHSGVVEVHTNQPLVMQNLLRGQENLEFVKRTTLGKDINGKPIQARFVWDYKNQSGRIEYTNTSTGADLAHELGHFVDRSVGSAEGQRLSDMIPAYATERPALERSLTGYLVARNGSMKSKQIQQAVFDIAMKLPDDVEALTAGSKKTPAERFADAVKEVITNPKEAAKKAPRLTDMVQHYLKRNGKDVMTREIKSAAGSKKKPVVINPDNLKEAAGDFDPAHHEKYSAEAKRQYAEALKTNQNPLVKFTAGGSGSGKSELVFKTIAEDFDGIIVDGTLAEYDAAVKKINQATSAGKQVEIDAILPRITSAWKFVQKREILKGRGVPLDEFIRMHVGFAKTLVKLTEAGYRVRLRDTRNIWTKEDAKNAPFIDDPKKIVDILSNLGYNEGRLKEDLKYVKLSEKTTRKALAARENQRRAVSQGNGAPESGGSQRPQTLDQLFAGRGADQRLTPATSGAPSGTSKEAGFLLRQQAADYVGAKGMKLREKQRPTLGDCYQAASDYIIHHPNDGWTLVHGDVTGQGAIEGQRYGHAWLEKGDTVLDVSNGRNLEIPRAKYYELGQIDSGSVVRYDRKQTLDKLLTYETYGPWTDTADYKMPEKFRTKDQAEAMELAEAIRKMKGQSQPAQIQAKAIARFGITKDETKSLFILSDGRLLGNRGLEDGGEHRNFSEAVLGRKEKGAEDSLAHRGGMVEIISYPRQDLVARVYGSATPDQVRTIMDLASDKKQVFVDVFKANDFGPAVKSYDKEHLVNFFVDQAAAAKAERFREVGELLTTRVLKAIGDKPMVKIETIKNQLNQAGVKQQEKLIILDALASFESSEKPFKAKVYRGEVAGAGNKSLGEYYTTEKDRAQLYADYKSKKTGGKGSIAEAAIELSRPLRLSEEHLDAFESLKDRIPELKKTLDTIYADEEGTKTDSAIVAGEKLIQDYAKNNGYDGVIFGNGSVVIKINDAKVTKPGEIPTAEFKKRVQEQLLPLELLASSTLTPEYAAERGIRTFGSRWENINLPDEFLEGAEYEEHVWESPITTSAGRTHFGGVTEKYFGHTRTNTFDNGEMRQVIEVQSDLYQKGRLEHEYVKAGIKGSGHVTHIDDINQSLRINGVARTAAMLGREAIDSIDSALRQQQRDPASYSESTVARWKELRDFLLARKNPEVVKLAQYNDPTAHFRMVREEVKLAAEDDVQKLRFPTGETAMMIEGLYQHTDRYNWLWHSPRTRSNIGITEADLPERVGEVVWRFGDAGAEEKNQWVITGIKENGQFTAMQMKDFRKIAEDELGGTVEDLKKYIKQGDVDLNAYGSSEASLNETFSIADKPDTTHPIYKFYQDEMAKYLRSRYGAKEITDDNGVTWNEVTIKPEMAGPVEAFRTKEDQYDMTLKKLYDNPSMDVKEVAGYLDTDADTVRQILDDMNSYATINDMGDYKVNQFFRYTIEQMDNGIKNYRDLIKYEPELYRAEHKVLDKAEMLEYRSAAATTRQEKVLAIDAMYHFAHATGAGFIAWGYGIDAGRGGEFIETALKAIAKGKFQTFRIKDDFAKLGIQISDAQETQIKELNKKFFGNDDVKVVEQILTPNGQEALGAYKDGMVRILRGQSDAKDTYLHEAVHKYLDVVTTADEHVDLLLTGKEKYGIDDFAQIEERLAEDFIKFAKSHEGVTGKLKIAFNRILLRIERMFGNSDKIQELYTDIMSGKGRQTPKNGPQGGFGPKAAPESAPIGFITTPRRRTRQEPTYEPIAGTGLRSGHLVRNRLSYNPDKFNTTEDVENLFKEISAGKNEFKSQRLSKTNADIQRLSTMVNVSVDDLLKTKPGSIANAETVKRAIDLSMDSVSDLRDYIKTIDSSLATPAELAILKKKLFRATGIMKTVAGFRTEASNIFRTFNIPRTVGENNALTEILKELKRADIDTQDLEQFAKKTNEIMEPTTMDKFWHLWYASILSGASTHIKNFVGNSLNMTGELAVQGVTDPAGFNNAITGLWDGLALGKQEALRIMREGDINKFEERGIKPVVFDLGAKKATGWQKSVRETGAWILNRADYVGRAMSAVDAIFKEGFRGMELRAIAREEMSRKGYAGADLKARINEFVANPPQSAADAALEYALRGTYNNKPTGAIGAIANGLGGIVRRIEKTGENANRIKNPVLRTAAKVAAIPTVLPRMILPFTRVVANVANVALDWTPVGLPRILNPDLTPRARRQEMGRAFMGTMAMLYLGNLAAQGLISGTGPSDSKKKQQLKDAGWQPNSIKIGNAWYPYQNWGQMALGMTIVGNYFDNGRYSTSNNDQDLTARLTLATLGSVKSFVDTSFLSGVSALSSALENLDQGGEQYFKNFIASQAASIEPNLIKQTARYFDTTQYETSGIREQILSNMRITSGLKPRLNVFGQPIKGTALTQLSPTTVTSDKTIAFLAENQLWISVPSKATKIKPYKELGHLPKNGRQMNEDEYYNYLKYSGIQIKKQLDSALPRLQKLPADQRQKAIDDIVTSVHDGVKRGIEMGLIK